MRNIRIQGVKVEPTKVIRSPLAIGVSLGECSDHPLPPTPQLPTDEQRKSLCRRNPRKNCRPLANKRRGTLLVNCTGSSSSSSSPSSSTSVPFSTYACTGNEISSDKSGFGASQSGERYLGNEIRRAGHWRQIDKAAEVTSAKRNEGKQELDGGGGHVDDDDDVTSGNNAEQRVTNLGRILGCFFLSRRIEIFYAI